MLTKNQVLEQIKSGKRSETLDGRDYLRLSDFFEDEHLETLGFCLKDNSQKRTVLEWTEGNILKKLELDVEFAFEKALDKRGLSAGFMHSVVKMWMWILEDHELHNLADEIYAQYGLPFLKAVAVKYGLKNEIGDDEGNEFKYSADADYADND